MQAIKISNSQRQQKRKRVTQKYNHLTPEKYLNRESMYRTVDRMQKKFGYDYDTQDSKTLQYMKQQFIDKTFNYLGRGQWTKKMGRKDKYERNLQMGRPLQKNPLLKIFNRIENKAVRIDKSLGFQALKRLL